MKSNLLFKDDIDLKVILNGFIFFLIFMSEAIRTTVADNAAYPHDSCNT